MSSNYLQLTCLNAEDIRFSRNANGFLMLTLCGEARGRVKLTRAYPQNMPFMYIGISDNDNKEIGIIRDISALDKESEELARAELGMRYYCPEISHIKSIKEKMGSFYFETTVGEKKKNFTVKDISRNVRPLDNGSVQITDSDGNRYIIPDFEKTDKKNQRLLEPYLY